VDRAETLAQMVVDRRARVLLVCDRARALLGDAGDECPVELGDGVHAALRDGHRIRLGPLDLRGRRVEVDITPLHDGDDVGGAAIAWLDVPAAGSARAELGSAVRDLEQTNDELGSTSAELERVNEELNSTNVELEAMSEALGITSVELERLNETLRRRSEQLDDATAFLGELLVGLRAAVVICDRDERISAWNSGAELLWGMPARAAIGRRLGELELGAPTQGLLTAMRGCMAGGPGRRHLGLDVADEHGAVIRCDVVLATREGRRQCVVAVMRRDDA
jgi:PAS domain-containing protein